MTDNNSYLPPESLGEAASSIKPGSQIPAYDASKAGLAGLMRHAALEGSHRQIRANVVAPGLVDTALGRHVSKNGPPETQHPYHLGVKELDGR